MSQMVCFFYFFFLHVICYVLRFVKSLVIVAHVFAVCSSLPKPIQIPTLHLEAINI